MGFIQITNRKTGKTYDSRSKNFNSLGNDVAVTAEGIIPLGNYYEKAFHGETDFDLEKYLDVLFDEHTPEVKQQKIQEYKNGCR